MKDYYYILGLQRNASLEEIKKAHRKLSQKFHPDKNQGDKYFGDRFMDIQEAFEILNDQEKKRIYDQKLDYNSHIERNHQIKEEELRKKEEELRKRENAIKERSNNFINKDQQYSPKLDFVSKQSQSTYSNPKYQTSGPWVNQPHKTNNFPKAVLGFFAVLAFIIIASVIARQNKEPSITNDNNRQENNISKNESTTVRQVSMNEIDRREDSLRKVLLGDAAVKQLNRNQIEGNSVATSPQNNKAIEYNKAGCFKYMLKDYVGAIEDFDKAIEVNSQFAEAYHNRGLAKDKIKEYFSAIQDFDKAIEINPQTAEAYRNRGAAKEHLRYFNEAIQDYNKAIEIDPQFSKAYNNRGFTKSTLQDFNGAISDFTKAIEINPQFSVAYNNRGEAKIQLKDYSKAIEDFDKAIEINPQVADSYNNRGLAKHLLGDDVGACEDWNKAVMLGLLNAYDFIRAYCK